MCFKHLLRFLIKKEMDFLEKVRSGLKSLLICGTNFGNIFDSYYLNVKSSKYNGYIILR